VALQGRSASRAADDFRRLLFTAGNGSVADYWHDVSYGNFNNGGSEVHGWYRLSQTTAQFQALARFDRVNVCLDRKQRSERPADASSRRHPLHHHIAGRRLVRMDRRRLPSSRYRCRIGGT